MTLSRPRVDLCLFLLSLLILLPGLGRRDIVNSHEARVIQTARTMAAAGWPWESPSVSVPAVELGMVDGFKRLLPRNDRPPMTVNPWLIPVMTDSLRLQKPPVPYWCVAISLKLFGDNEIAARLPSVLLGAASIMLLADLARRLFGRRTGWFVGLAWLSLYFVYDENRKAMADPYLAFFSLLAVWGYVRANHLLALPVSRVCGKGHRSSFCILHSAFCFLPSAFCTLPSASSVRPPPQPSPGVPGEGAMHSAYRHQAALLTLLACYASLALGLLSKGPVVFLHAIAGILAYHLAFRIRPAGTLWQHFAGLLLLVVIALPWPIAVVHRLPMAWDLWWYESIGEFGENREKPRGPFFYLPALLLLSLPWIAVWLPHAIGSLSRWWFAGKPSARRRRELFPLLWLAIIVGILSLSHVKKNAYLLPIMPAVAISVGLGLKHILATLRPNAWPRIGTVSLARRSNLGSRWIIGSIVLTTTAVSVVMPFGQPWIEPFTTVTPPSPAIWQVIGFALLGVLAAVITTRSAIRSRGRNWPAVQSLTFALLVSLFFQTVNSPVENRKSAKSACREAIRLLAEGGRTISTDQLAEEVAVYLPVDVKSAVPTDSGTSSKVLFLRDDADGVEARAHGLPTPPFNPIGRQFAERRVIAFRQVPIAENPGDVRWKLFELTMIPHQ